MTVQDLAIVCSRGLRVNARMASRRWAASESCGGACSMVRGWGARGGPAGELGKGEPAGEEGTVESAA